MILVFLEWDGAIDSVQFDQFHPDHAWSESLHRCGVHYFQFIPFYVGF